MTYRTFDPSDLEVKGCRLKLTHIETNQRKHVFERHVVGRAQAVHITSVQPYGLDVHS